MILCIIHHTSAVIAHVITCEREGIILARLDLRNHQDLYADSTQVFAALLPTKNSTVCVCVCVCVWWGVVLCCRGDEVRGRGGERREEVINRLFIN